VSPLDTDRLREELLEERRRVVGAISYLHAENPGSMRDESQEPGMDNHLGDSASVTLDREIDYTLEENAEHVLAEIDAALARMEDGTYGTCRTCGRPISDERLAAMPYASQCIDCKRREERA
jgi:DnaK suppressor protein